MHDPETHSVDATGLRFESVNQTGPPHAHGSSRFPTRWLISVFTSENPTSMGVVCEFALFAALAFGGYGGGCKRAEKALER